jgi:type IV secretion system protein VirD4
MKTNVFLKKLGYEVLALDFKNPSKSQRYNLLQPVINAVNDDDTDKAEMLAWDLTNNLVGKPEGEKIWTNGECAIIAAAILCVVCDNRRRPDYQNLTNVYWFVAEMCKMIGNKMPLLEYVKKLPQAHPARALLSISDVAPSRTRGSFYTSALTTLRLFTSKSIYAITHKSDFEAQDVGRKKQALFIILPDEKTVFYPVASLIVSQLCEMLANFADTRGGRLAQRVNFVLDEFGNFTTISDFTNKLTVGAGRGMRFNLFIQSFSQLKEKYDENTSDTIKANCRHGKKSGEVRR